MDLAPHSSAFLLGNDECGVNVARRLLIVHHDFGDRLDRVQMFDLILVVCWPWSVLHRLDIWEGVDHLSDVRFFKGGEWGLWGRHGDAGGNLYICTFVEDMLWRRHVMMQSRELPRIP